MHLFKSYYLHIEIFLFRLFRDQHGYIILLFLYPWSIMPAAKVSGYRPNWRQYNSLLTVNRRQTLCSIRVLLQPTIAYPHPHPLNRIISTRFSSATRELLNPTPSSMQTKSTECLDTHLILYYCSVIARGVQWISLHCTLRVDLGTLFCLSFASPNRIRHDNIITNPERAITR